MILWFVFLYLGLRSYCGRSCGKRGRSIFRSSNRAAVN